MEQLSYFLSKLCGDIFKLLPMKEAEIELGVINHIPEYLENLIFNTKGALVTYPELKCEKSYLYVINNLNYLYANKVDFMKWRRTILNSTKSIGKLANQFGGR